MKKSLLIITTIFPNPKNMSLGSYNREIVTELSEYYDIDVIVPIPWTQCLRTGTHEDWLLRRARVHHPIYFYPSGCLHHVHYFFYYISIRRLIKKLTLCKTYSAVFGMWLYPDGMVAKRIAQMLSVPYFVKVLGTDVNRLDMDHKLFSLSMDVLQNVSRVFCVSEGLKKRLESLGAASDKLLVIRNGINKTIFSPRSVEDARQKLDLPIKIKIVLFVGNLKREKGLHELICSFCKIKDTTNHADTMLFLIGEGPFERELRQYAILNGISESVVFLGRKTPSDVALWMNAATLLCLPSYSEGMPNVVLEALSCHTPVVATSIDGIAELACQDDRITLVPPREVDSLADAIITVIERGCKISGGLAINSWADFASIVSRTIGEHVHGDY